MRVCNLLVAVCLMPAPTAAQSPALPAEGDEGAEEAQHAAGIGRVHVGIRLQATEASLDGMRTQQRAIVHTGPWELAALSERDPGEGRWHDHVVGYAQRTTSGMDLTVGHLRPAFGQGLLFGRGRSTGVPTPAPRREGPTLGYRSSSEGRTIEGAVVRLRGARWTAALLAGRLRWDARIDTAGIARSLPDDGDHSGSDAATRGRLRGTITACRWTARAGRTDMGLSVQRLTFLRDVDLRRDGTPYAFHGRGQWSGAVDLQARRGRVRWYGAAARAGSRIGALAGVSGLAAAGVRVDLIGRWYGPGFFSPLGAAVSGADMDDERGLTAQARGRGWRAWVDATTRPAPRWRQPPSAWKRGVGVHVQTRGGNRQWSADLQRRGRSLWVAGAPGLESTTRARVQGRWTRHRLRVTARVDAVGTRRALRGAPESVVHGISGSAALRWRRRRMRLEGLATLFATEGYSTRIYAYEPELPGALSIRPLYGRGARLVAVTVVPIGHLSVSARWRLQVSGDGVRHVLGLQIEAISGSR